MKRVRFSLYTMLVCFLIGICCLKAQLSIFSDFYISSGNQVHIAFPTTYFKGGKIIAERSLSKGVVSFAEGSAWEGANDQSHVDGLVRIYHKGDFTFPVGANGLFSPIKVASLYLKNPHDFLEIQYTKEVFFSYPKSADMEAAPKENYWSWTPVKGTGQLVLNWSAKHGLQDLVTITDLIENIQIAALHVDKQWQLFDSKDSEGENNHNSWSAGSLKTTHFVNLQNYEAVSFALKRSGLEIAPLISQVITPNGDRVNDTWKIQGVLFSNQSKTRIYDAVGQLVFAKEGVYENDWTGNEWKNAKPLKEGLYYYTIDLEGDGNLNHQGWILLKRN